MEYTGATQRSRHFVPPSPPGGPVFQAPRRKGRLSDRTLIEEIQVESLHLDHTGSLYPPVLRHELRMGCATQ